MELFSIRIQRTFQLVSTRTEQLHALSGQGRRHPAGGYRLHPHAGIRGMAEGQGDMSEQHLLLYAEPACRLQPCGGQGTDDTAQPFQTCLHRDRQDRKTCCSVESDPHDTRSGPSHFPGHGIRQGHVHAELLYPWHVVR